jgi:flagellar motor switch protein FliN
MAPKKAKIEDEAIVTGDNNAELDQAIDDLRGVLKADQEGAPTLDSDFGAEFETTADTSDFGGFQAGESLDDAFGETPAFGGAITDDSSFGETSFGDSDFTDTSFGSSAPQSSMPEPGSGLDANMDLIKDIPIDVQIILGSSRMQVSGLMNLTEGAIIPLDRKIGEPVDLVVNGRLIGRGEITVLENDESRFGIRLLEVRPSGR